MSVFLENYGSIKDQVGQPCSICLQPLKKKRTVGHFNGGDKHPVHKICIIAWLRRQQFCPSCMVPFTAQKITRRNREPKDARFSSFFGATLCATAIALSIMQQQEIRLCSSSYSTLILNSTISAGISIPALSTAFFLVRIIPPVNLREKLSLVKDDCYKLAVYATPALIFVPFYLTVLKSLNVDSIK